RLDRHPGSRAGGLEEVRLPAAFGRQQQHPDLPIASQLVPAHRVEPPDVNSPAPVHDRRVPTRLAVATLATLAAGFGLVYLIHLLLSSQEGSPLALLIAVGWTAACAVVTSLGSRHRMAGLLLTALALVVIGRHWSWLQARVDLVYLIQHAGSHALL